MVSRAARTPVAHPALALGAPATVGSARSPNRRMLSCASAAGGGPPHLMLVLAYGAPRRPDPRGLPGWPQRRPRNASSRPPCSTPPASWQQPPTVGSSLPAVRRAPRTSMRMAPAASDRDLFPDGPSEHDHTRLGTVSSVASRRGLRGFRTIIQPTMLLSPRSWAGIVNDPTGVDSALPCCHFGCQFSWRQRVVPLGHAGGQRTRRAEGERPDNDADPRRLERRSAS